MAPWQRSPLRRASSPAARRKPSASRKTHNLSLRSLRLEPFEERLLFAITPHLVAILPNPALVLADPPRPETTLDRAPTELTFRFDSDIDPLSLLSNPQLPGIQIRRGTGPDGNRGTSDDPLVVPSYMAIGDHANEVVVRFAQASARQPFTLPNGTPLPDSPLLDPTMPNDVYQIRIVGSGPNPIRGTNGAAFNAGQDVTRDFTLDLAPQVVAVVPQPVTRGDNGKLNHGLNDIQLNRIDVYFNQKETLDVSSVLNKTFYELIRTTDGSDQAIPQQIKNPFSVSYSDGKAVLTFLATDLNVPGVYRLRIGNADPLPLPTEPDTENGDAGSSLTTAQNLGGQFPSPPTGTQSISITGTIIPKPVTVLYPGGNNEPGVRTINAEDHGGLTPGTGDVAPIQYNFKHEIGTVLGAPAFNDIDNNEAQKQRVREVFSYYSHYLGMQFVETADQGWTIATGDPRAVDPNVPTTSVRGLASNSLAANKLAVMNSFVDWGDSESGGSFFQTAMHLIGNLLGLGETYELPGSVQGTGVAIADSRTGEPVFPGDSDILLGQYLHPPVGNDVDLYKFSLPRDGVLSLETIAQRLADLNPTEFQLDSVISLFDINGKLLARNDDYYGNDSFLQLALTRNTYYVAVSSTGNTNFDVNIEDTGFGGTTHGRYDLKLTFTPTAPAGIRDTDGTPTPLDGDGDGSGGGIFNFWFRVADTAHTFYVDKVATAGTGALGSITNPYTTITAALNAPTDPTGVRNVVRIVGNGGADGNVATIADNLSYNVGFDNLGNPLPDGETFEIPAHMTVMIDAGAIIKLRAANIDVGTSEVGLPRDGGALQILGTVTGTRNDAQDPLLRDDAGAVYITSYYTTGIGTDAGTAKDPVAAGNWGGLVFRHDSDLESAGIFLNSVNHANISYGGGEVVVNSVPQVFAPIHLVSSRPSVSFNIISRSADSAVSADPNSFLESEFQQIRAMPLAPFVGTITTDYTRSGPSVHGNTLSDNSINGLFVRIRTENGASLDLLTVPARFTTTDMVYVIKENLLIAGSPGGSIIDETGFHTRTNARLAIDPGVIVKLGGARIETQLGTQLIAEGTAARPIIFTSELDDRYGAGGVFDTTNDNKPGMTPEPVGEGNWGGLFFGPLSTGSVDHALITFGGGRTTIEGGFGTFNAVEIHQAQVRLANSTLQNNAAGGGGDRNGRSSSTRAVIFVRGAQPVLIDNVIQNNDTAPPTDPNAPINETAAISADLNSLNAAQVSDWGRSVGPVAIQTPSLTNTGPLIRGNQLGNNPINGLLVRGGTVSTNVIWDDTDIVHVLLDEVKALNQFSVDGTLRLQSTATESLVVKLLGSDAGFTAGGTPLDINDRIGGTVQIVGVPNHPVVLTSLFDNTVGAGFTPSGSPQNDTANSKSTSSQPPPTTSGPVFLDGGDRDDHGSRNNQGNQAGWKFIEQAVNFANTNSLNTAGDGILAIGVQTAADPTRAEAAIRNVADVLGLSLTIVSGGQISTADFSRFKVIYVPSDGFDTPGGISDGDLGLLTARKLDVQTFVNTLGGGLVALTEDVASQPYGWLELPDTFTIAHTGGTVLAQTPLLAAAGFTITDQELIAGTPWHNSFVGPPGFNRLQPWVIDPNTGAVVTLGSGPGGGGIGPRLNIATPGDWRSVKLDAFSNDTNVELVNELEQGFAPTGDTNALSATAQFVGSLAKDLKSGDDILRLGIEIHGSISQTVASSPYGGDVDVYSFKGTAGTTVWFDIDRTSSSLDTVVELVDAGNTVVARSNNSWTETANPGQLVGLIARPLQVGYPSTAAPFASPDFYSTNPLDAGMRLDLPGAAGTVNTYFVRVRANSATLNTPNAGVTKGAYQLQLRLRDTDMFPGSVVRGADIRFADTGVEVIGKPERSPLMGDTAETSTTHNLFVNAQNLGNLLASDTGAINVAGNLGLSGEIDFYKFDLNYDLVQSIAGFTDKGRVFPTLFQINYADGLTRPDTTLSLFDQDGNLIYIGRDSDNPDSLPRSSMGTDTTNTSHGSFGTLDPTIGSVNLPAGSPVASQTSSEQFTYYLAVSASNRLPQVLDATFLATATNPLVRLQPVNSVTRIFDDSIGSATTPTGQQAFPGTTPGQLNTAATPFSLADVVAYVNTFGSLYTINPFTGQVQTLVTDNTGRRPNIELPNFNNRSYLDIAMRSDGRLMTYPISDNGNASVNGTYLQINTADGSQLTTAQGGVLGSTAITTFDVDPDNPINPPSAALPFFNYSFVTPDGGDSGIAVHGMAYGDYNFTPQGTTLYIVGNRTAGNGTILNTQNLLFRVDANSGAPFGGDFESNRDFHSGATAYQPRLGTALDPHPEGPASGTAVIPRGTLSTGRIMVAKAATDLSVGIGNGTSLTDIVDGARFTILSGALLTTFEFDSGPQLNLDNAAVPGQTGIAALRNGQTFQIQGSLNTRVFQLVSGPVLNAVGTGPALVGQTFSITDNLANTLTFEFVSQGNPAAPGHVAVNTANTAAGVAANIVTAINVTAPTQFPALNYQVHAAVPTATSTRVTLTGDLEDNAAVDVTGAPGLQKQGNWDLLPAVATENVVRFEETDSIATFGASLAQTVSDAFGGQVSASFARDRVTFAGALSANLTTFTGNASGEFSRIGNGGVTGAGTKTIRFNAADTATDIANAIRNAIDAANIPAPIVFQQAPTTIDPTLVGTSVHIPAGQFFSESNLALNTDGPGTIEGIAVLPTPFVGFFQEDMYAASSTGAIYKVNNYFFDDGAQLELLNVYRNANGTPVDFTGLTAGPPHVENGRYARNLFATDSAGNIWAFDSNGQPAPILLDGATKVRVFENSAFGIGSSFSTFLQGITFSTLDYNAWHATTTQGSDPLGAETDNKSFYFGFEQANFRDIDDPTKLPSAYWQPGAPNTTVYVGWTGNPSLFSSYNLPGGALGSLQTAEFDLSAYSASDKPTLYFNYALDTETVDGINDTGDPNKVIMRDSFRVFASSDGAVWKQLGTNNSIRSSAASPAATPSAELPPIASVNGGQYENDRVNQQVQELFDQPGLPAPDGAPVGSPTSASNWRQARIDLGDFAGKSNVVIRFDFSTAGSMGIGALKQGGVYLAGVAGSKLQDLQQFVIDGAGFTFRSGFILQAPVGGGAAIQEGETFTVNGTMFTLSRTTAGPGIITVNNNDSAEDVAAKIAAGIGIGFVRVGARVQLLGATSASLGPGSTLILQGSASVAGGGNIPYTIDMTDDAVAIQVATALDRVFTVSGSVDDPSNFTSSKVTGRTIRLYGHNVNSAGPLPYSNTLPGDQFGSFYSPLVFDPGSGLYIYTNVDAAKRGENNAHQGVFIDDVIVGFAGRGEQVLNARLADGTSVSTFGPQIPFDPAGIGGTRITTGPYQLSIRRGSEYASGPIVDDKNKSVFSPSQTFDINDRFAQGFTLYAVPASQIADGDKFTILSDGGVVTFEFKRSAAAPLSNVNNVRVVINNNDDAAAVALAMRNAINNVSASLKFNVKAGLNVTPSAVTRQTAAVNLFGAIDVDVDVNFNPGPLTKTRFGSDDARGLPVLGDALPVRLQGQTLIQGNRISDTNKAGVNVGPVTRDEPPNSGFAINTYTSNTPVNILDDATVSSTIAVFDSGTITDLNVQVNILHSFDADLDVFLIAPNGERVALFRDLGGSDNNFSNTLLDDQAGTPISQGSAPFTGTFSPEGLLSRFNGLNPLGTWTLQIIDDTPADVGTLLGWSLIISMIIPETNALLFGTPGHTSSVLQPATINSTALVPGITIKNNLVIEGGLTGIQFGGTPRNDIPSAVPFGRIVNNTVVSTPTGIKVVNNASPTILNNAFADYTTAISVDGTSTSTVVGANIYQRKNNLVTDLSGVGQTNPIVLQPTDPLFVDVANRNVYLKQNSLAIDSSVNSLQERPTMQVVASPLGISPSPIQAPEFDLQGQLRVDDAAVPSPPGLGSNVFKDRGAIERSDVLGPTASLRDPIDNDAAGVDKFTGLGGVNKVTIVGKQLTEFVIQLNDAGLGVDDASVDATKFTVTSKVGNVTTTLLAGTHYAFGYDSTNKIVRIVPLAGLWPNATYTITLNNVNSATPITDSVGNALQPNEATGVTQFVIQQTDKAISPWQNPLNQFDVNANGTVSGIDALLVINRVLNNLSGPIPVGTPAPPYIDVDGNGSLGTFDVALVINYLITHPASPQVEALVSSEIVAAPASATSSAVVSPAIATPSAAVSPDANAALVGVALSQLSSADDNSADGIVQGSATWAADAAVSNVAKAPATAAVSAALAATFEAEDFDGSDSDWDSILSDLTEDSCQLATA